MRRGLVKHGFVNRGLVKRGLVKRVNILFIETTIILRAVAKNNTPSLDCFLIENLYEPDLQLARKYTYSATRLSLST